MKEYSLSKSEKLKSRKIITDLFQRGKSVFVYPIKLVYMPIVSAPDDPHINNDSKSPALFSVTVPKKLFKKAVQRNKIKRQVREQYRLLKPSLYENLMTHETKLALMYIYIGKKETDTSLLPKAIKDLHKKLTKQIGPS